MIGIGFVRLPPQQRSKVSRGVIKYELKTTKQKTTTGIISRSYAIEESRAARTLPLD